jgi:hypothetical protein
VRTGFDALDAENREAWTVFQSAVTRFTFDLHLVPLVLAPVLDARPPEARADLVARLTLLYDTLYPPPKAKDA